MSNDRSETLTRYPRIDFLRGVALLLVLIDHIEACAQTKLVSAWTPISLGYSDASDAFVCLSGVCFGLAYSKRLTESGLLRSIGSATRRSAEILCAYWVLTVSLVFMCHTAKEPPLMLLAAARGVSNVDWGFLFQVATLQYHPFGISILLLYAVLLPAMPVWLWLWKRSPILALCLSFGIYQWAQWHWFGQGGVWLFAPRAEFNPAGWQFLYCLAAALGCYVRSSSQQNQHEPPAIRVLRSRWTVILAALFVFVVLTLRKLIPDQLLAGCNHATWLLSWIDQQPPWGHRSVWQPVRAVHFGCLAIVVIRSLASLKLEKEWYLKWILVYGQSSLIAYSSGLFLTYATIFLFQAVGNQPFVVIVVESGIVALTLGIIAGWRRLFNY